MRRIRKIMLILTILMASVTVMAQTALPVILSEGELPRV